MTTKIYNLIILDESGSMGCVWHQTISGCNETINTIKSAQEQYADTQEHYVSIYAFQGGADVLSRYLVKNVRPNEVKPITEKDYKPWGNTPLLDAVGGTLADLKAVVAGEEQAIGSVTIITDGYENSSKYYSSEQVANMIAALKELGWGFNFIGANIDVELAAKRMNIDNYMEFKQDECGTQEMFGREHDSRMRYYQRSSQAMHEAAMENDAVKRKKELIRRMQEAAKGYFEK